MFQIRRALPEQTGIPSACVVRFMERLERRQIPMHSFLLMHRDRLVCESYYAPCGPDTLHRMFSITKSFTSVAIGLLADEGALSLNDPIVRYFPEKVPADVHPYIAEMTIRDMLMMRTCHAKTTYKLDMEKDWVESFFTTEPSHPAGMIFHYDTSAAHTLCALVEKLTGTDMLSYIKKKLAPLEFSAESFLVKDPFGVSLGGSGLVATPMDILKFGIFLYRSGKIDGRQLISPAYLEEAVSCLTATCVTAPIPGEACGYGMQFWRTRHNGYMCYGMGGQLVIVLPDRELICVTTADTQGIGGGNQQIYDALYEEILPYIGPDGGEEPDPARAGAYRDFLSTRTLYIPEGAADNPLSGKINGREYRVQNSSSFGTIRLEFRDSSTREACSDAGLASDREACSDAGLASDREVCSDAEPARTAVSKTVGTLRFTYEHQPYTITFGMGFQEAGMLPLYSFRYAASGVWLADDTLYVKVNVIDSSVGSIHLQFSFRGDTMTLFMRKQEESLLQEFNGHLIAKYS